MPLWKRERLRSRDKPIRVHATPLFPTLNLETILFEVVDARAYPGYPKVVVNPIDALHDLNSRMPFTVTQEAIEPCLLRRASFKIGVRRIVEQIERGLRHTIHFPQTR